jgi:hypothetical protein
MIPIHSFLDELEKIGEQSPYAQQLERGIEVEKEHKGTVGWLKKNPDAPPKAAYASIAGEHLDEDKKYYTHLDEMETKYVKKESSSSPERLCTLYHLRKASSRDKQQGGNLKKQSVYAGEQQGDNTGSEFTQGSEGTVRG